MSATQDQLVQQLAEKLNEKKWSLATAESCTGGGLSAAITSRPGSSTWFERGFVTYSNAAKIELLGVKKSTLDKEGAVSAKCALEMAIGGLANSKADICISITGIAGPDGGTKDKPVGTIFIAITYDSQTFHQAFLFHGDRNSIREQTITAALKMLIKSLTK